ncbi:MAG: glycoside hydrolase family 16 protein, partial [Bacteroidota bacterium]
GGATEPQMPAPAPTQAAGDVISLFSDAFTDVAVDTWRTPWSNVTFEDVTVDGNATKKYSLMDVAGIETTSSTVNATEMTMVHMDVWSSDFTQFSIKLVDFGADNAFAGGDDSEHQVDIMMPEQGGWVSIDIPLSDFVNLQSRANLAQYILVAQPSGTATVFVDNFYFYK